MKPLVILQARTSSRRLPRKVMHLVNDYPIIGWQIKRILKADVENLILATSNDKSDDELADFGSTLGVTVFRGALDDVFSRFSAVIDIYKPASFMRLTGDCPFVMPSLINRMSIDFIDHSVDYLSNTNPPTYPDGLDIEIVSSKAFQKLANFELNQEEKEHVTLGIHSRPGEFSIRNYRAEVDRSDLRWTLDYPEDLEFIKSVFKHFQGSETEFEIDDVLNLLKTGAIQNNLLGNEFRNISITNGDLGK